MYKVGDHLDLSGDLLDTNHPLEDVEKLRAALQVP